MQLTTMQSSLIVMAIYLTFALLELAYTRLFAKDEQTRHDGILEIVSTVMLLVVTQPMILFAVGTIGHAVAPQYANALAGIPFLAALGLFLLFEDMMQYWWHRASHSFGWLYNLHRAHHNARYMSVRLVYRNNILYYAMMPSIWFAGALVYLGLGWFYAGYLVVKMAVIIGAHSDFAWDKPLYRIKALSPVMWVIERTISTPATHHAHHGRHLSDGAVHYKGNFGNLLFFSAPRKSPGPIPPAMASRICRRRRWASNCCGRSFRKTRICMRISRAPYPPGWDRRMPSRRADPGRSAPPARGPASRGGDAGPLCFS
jgi:sterol desaturase/sphingolipid hydroxylase (fatty acid hydroxylase superfamily)